MIRHRHILLLLLVFLLTFTAASQRLLRLE